MKTAVFGGTFDPVHNTHIALAKYVLAESYAERILFIPAPSPPHKLLQNISPYRIRRAMLSIAIENMAACTISDVELDRQGRSYTVDTLKILSQNMPCDDILLLIGADSLRDLHLWRNPDEIVRLHKLLVYPRKGVELSLRVLEKHWSKPVARMLMSCIMANAPCSDISSTEIRRLASLGSYAKLAEMVPFKVAEYIKTNKLYI